jgi:hypothetical protein
LLLVGIWLWLVFSAGGYAAKDWAFPALAVGVIGVVAASLLGYPGRPRQLSLAVLALFAAYALWVLASNLWGASSSRAWMATGRTFTYLLVLALALAFFTSSRARTAFKHLLMTASFVLLVICIWRLWSAGDLTQLFVANRFAYPIGHADSAAALFLVPFWPLVWLAAGPAERAPVRGAALGLATGLMGLAMMAQSRSAVWSFGISLIIVFALSPGRLRLLFHLVAPGLLMVYAFPHLNQYWTQNPAILSGGLAARTLTVAALAGGFIGMIVALLESWVKVSGRMKAIFGTVVLAGCTAGLIYGAVTLTQDVGGPMAWFGDTWNLLVSEPAADKPAPSGAAQGTDAVSMPTRADVWRAAWQQSQQTPILGAGADNSAAATPSSPDPSDGASSSQAPHADSLVLRVLSDTGIVGGVLVFGAIVLSVGGLLWPRTAAGWSRVRRTRRRGGGAGAENGERRVGRRRVSRWGSEPMIYGWEMALLAGTAFWFIDANLEQLWRTTGITVAVILMLAAALAAADAQAGALWPRLAAKLRRGPVSQTETAAEDAPSEEAAGAEAAGGRSRAGRKEKRRRFPHGRLRPEGLLSEAFRVGLIVLSAAVLILAASAYLLELV